ncbi:MAG: zinc ribbon domain-containing protein [Candidatus Eisenbacteria bacterium]|nr:zinc ribbon domain-containing protein [Candidatus Eisenbacteria bacterium]
MPIYEYRCMSCQHFFSLLVFGREEIRCPKCGADQVEKQFSIFGVGGSSPSGAGPSCGHSGGS